MYVLGMLVADGLHERRWCSVMVGYVLYRSGLYILEKYIRIFVFTDRMLSYD